jgi:HSP20 family protein
MIYTTRKLSPVDPVDALIREYFHPANNSIKSNYTFRPKVNILESDKYFRLEIAAPGLNKEDFRVEVEDGHLHIALERRTDLAEGEKVHRGEFMSYRFERTFPLGDRINADSIEAAYEAGLLKITLPKTEKARPRTIDVG